MKTAYLTGIGQLEVRDAPEPTIGRPGDVLVRINAVGVCGSDIHYYATGQIGSQWVKFPETIGHECSGTVVATGSAVRSLEAWQLVAIDPLIACGECDQCLAGREHTCRRQAFLGSPGQAPGALTDYLVLPARCCHPVPRSMSAAQAAMVEPFSVAVYSAQLAALKPGSSVAILGSGPIGLCVLFACRNSPTAANLRIYATDLVNERVEAARRCGAAWAGNPQREDVVPAILEREPLGVDVVFECAGEQETLDQGAALLKPGGKLLIVGIPELDRISFDPHLLRRHELTVTSVRRQNKCVDTAIELIASGRVNVDPIITHRFPLGESQRAFDLVARYNDGVIKAIIELASSGAGD